MEGKIKALNGYTKTSLNIKNGTFHVVNPIQLGKYIPFNDNNLVVDNLHININSNNINEAVKEIKDRVSTKGRVWNKLKITNYYLSKIKYITGCIEHKGTVYVTAVLNEDSVSSYLLAVPLDGGTVRCRTMNGIYLCDICDDSYDGSMHMCGYSVGETPQLYYYTINEDFTVNSQLVYSDASMVINDKTVSHTYITCDDESLLISATLGDSSSIVFFRVIGFSMVYSEAWNKRNSTLAILKRPVRVTAGNWLFSKGKISEGQTNTTYIYVFRSTIGGEIMLYSKAGTVLFSCFDSDLGCVYAYSNSDKTIRKYYDLHGSASIVSTNIDMPVDEYGLSIFDYALIDGKHVYSMVDNADSKVKLWYAIKPFSPNRFSETMPTNNIPLYDFRNGETCWLARDIESSNNIYYTI